jgi:hypothetical protein
MWDPKRLYEKRVPQSRPAGDQDWQWQASPAHHGWIQQRTADIKDTYNTCAGNCRRIIYQGDEVVVFHPDGNEPSEYSTVARETWHRDCWNAKPIAPRKLTILDEDEFIARARRLLDLTTRP